MSVARHFLHGSCTGIFTCLWHATFYMTRAQEILHVCSAAFFYMARTREFLHVYSMAFFYMYQRSISRLQSRATLN
jgi:hypothetical protein